MILNTDQILDDQARVGDVYRVTYKSALPIARATQAKLVAQRIQAQEPRIGHVTAVVEGNKIIVEFVVVDNPFPLVAVLATIAVVMGGLFLFLSLERVEKISVSPLGSALALAIFAGAVLALLKITRR